MMEAEVSTLPNYETDIKFPPGPAGILLEPVVRCGNRSIGARVVGFAAAAADQDFFLKSPIADPASPSVIVHTLAAEHVCLGSVLMQLDDVCTQHLSFDRIMVRPTPLSRRRFYFRAPPSHLALLVCFRMQALLHEKARQTRRMRFKDVKASWMHSATRGSPSMEVTQNTTALSSNRPIALVHSLAFNTQADLPQKKKPVALISPGTFLCQCVHVFVGGTGAVARQDRVAVFGERAAAGANGRGGATRAQRLPL
jgi:hypothetical protein